jgi:eukaryotic-like serine/threonine-protein kinase
MSEAKPEAGTHAKTEAKTEARFARQAAETIDAPIVPHTVSSAPATGPLVEPVRLGRGAVLGRYVIEELIGAGGMGVVYRARDPDLGRAVAIKQLGRVRSDWQWRARLLREAQAMARLAHPSVVTVYDVGLAHDGLFVAMEYVEGVTLRRWLAEPRTRHEIIAAFAGAGRGLHAAHIAGLVHRDFKPDNVLMASDGRARVTDFGLARWETADALDDAASAPGDGAAAHGLTVADAVMGTPGYMAPEQYAGATVDARTDQFAFTCALYEALHGVRPFVGDPDAIREAVLAGRPLAHPRDLPAWLRRILDRGLDTDRERRFSSMAELVAALEADPAARRRRRVFAIGVAAIVVAAVGGYAAMVARDRDQRLAACREAPDELATSWNAQRKAAIAAGFGVADRPGRARTWGKLEQLVDHRAAALRAAREQTCLASARGEQSHELAAKRDACLDDRRDELVALVGLMAHKDSDPASLIAAARRLQSLDRCSDTDRLASEPTPAADPARRAALGEIRAALGTTRVMIGAGQLGLAMEQAQRATDRAHAAGDAALAAEAETALADAKLGGPDVRWPVIWQAMRDTAAAGTAQTHARAVTIVARDFAAGGKFDDAERWAWLAVGLTGRGGDLHDLALALTVLGHVEWQLGKANEALAALDRCVKTAQEPDVVSVGVGLMCMVMTAQVTVQFGQRDRTIAAADAVIKLGTDRGDELPARETYELWSNLAVVLINAHEERRALELLQRAQRLHDEAAAHDDPSAAVDIYLNAELAMERGVALLQLGRADDAADELAAARAGLAGFELLLVQAKLYGAEAERRRGRPGEARGLLHEIEGAQTLTPRDRVMLYTILANLELDRGDCKAADAAIARAAKDKSADESPDEQGDRLFAPARLAAARGRSDAPAQLAAARAAFDRAHNAFRVAEIDALHPAHCR